MENRKRQVKISKTQMERSEQSLKLAKKAGKRKKKKERKIRKSETKLANLCANERDFLMEWDERQGGYRFRKLQ